MIQLHSKKEVQEYPNNTLGLQPTVSVSVVTYNHAAYIKQCLDGILMQQTDFDFEILLGEDASTDGTREICITYADEHPDKIRLFLHHRENNIHVCGNPTGRFNFLYNLSKARGKYIAICEGDDYWSDPLKLKKQVNLLEKNPQASFCFSKAELLFETEPVDHSYRHMEHYPSLITLDNYLDNYYPMPHLTKIWRTQFNPDFDSSAWEIFINHVRFFDNALHMYHLIQGPAIFLDEITGVYRVQARSVTQTAPKDDRWHIQEILLSHYHFIDICPAELKGKFIAIRAHHFQKLFDHSISKKLWSQFSRDIWLYWNDKRSGTFLGKLSSVGNTLKHHLRLKLNLK